MIVPRRNVVAFAIASAAIVVMVAAVPFRSDPDGALDRRLPWVGICQLRRFPLPCRAAA
jgi:hypothetical protein